MSDDWRCPKCRGTMSSCDCVTAQTRDEQNQVQPVSEMSETNHIVGCDKMVQPSGECEVRKALKDAQEELRLLHMKDTETVYDPTLRGRIAIALSTPCTCEGIRADLEQSRKSVAKAVNLSLEVQEECARLRAELEQTSQKAEDEKQIRIKYQDIVYAADNALDVAAGRRISNSLPLAVTETVAAINDIVAEQVRLRAENERLHEDRRLIESRLNAACAQKRQVELDYNAAVVDNERLQAFIRDHSTAELTQWLLDQGVDASKSLLEGVKGLVERLREKASRAEERLGRFFSVDPKQALAGLADETFKLAIHAAREAERAECEASLASAKQEIAELRAELNKRSEMLQLAAENAAQKGGE